MGRDPRMSSNNIGKSNDDFTLNIDLAPTISSAAGITPPDSMQGRDISQLYIDQPHQSSSSLWRDEFYYEHPSIDDQEDWIPTSEALVRKNYKYILWPGHDNTEQLFDLINDPYEENDLIMDNGNVKDDIHKDILNEMRERFIFLKEEAK